MRFYRHLSFRMWSNVMIIKNKETRVDVPILHVGVCTNRTRITREVIYRSAQLSISGNLLMWLVCQAGFDSPNQTERIWANLVRKGNRTFGFKIPLLRKCYRHSSLSRTFLFRNTSFPMSTFLPIPTEKYHERMILKCKKRKHKKTHKVWHCELQYFAFLHLIHTLILCTGFLT